MWRRVPEGRNVYRQQCKEFEAPEERNISISGKRSAPPELKHLLASAAINIWPLCGSAPTTHNYATTKGNAFFAATP